MHDFRHIPKTHARCQPFCSCWFLSLRRSSLDAGLLHLCWADPVSAAVMSVLHMLVLVNSRDQSMNWAVALQGWGTSFCLCSRTSPERRSVLQDGYDLASSCSSCLNVLSVALVVKTLPGNGGGLRDRGLIPGLGRSPGGRTGNPLQYSCLGNATDRSLVGYSP